MKSRPIPLVYGAFGHALLLLLWMPIILANPPDSIEFFESRIRPLLVEKCYPCHSAETKQESGLLVDSRLALQKGGDRGAAINLENRSDSLLLHVVRGGDPDLIMPPLEDGVKLSQAEIADLEAWIVAGAVDPRVPGRPLASRKSWEELFQERMNWWSLKPLTIQSNATHNQQPLSQQIDHFIHQQHQQRQLSASTSADAHTLIRRAYLVLHGLAPSTTEIEKFEADYKRDSNNAYSSLIDRLLDSPEYGERFARHWMDVVRFTETHGNEWNYDVPYAWRYRDYLIRAFNQDLPYNQFLAEHIAGDLIEEPRWNTKGAFNESIIATSFYRFGEVNHDSCVQFSVIGYDIADNQLDTLTKAFQASTVACARCHDHKLDAISTEDYHGLLGVVRSTRSVQHTIDANEVNRESMTKLLNLKRSIHERLAHIWTKEIANLGTAQFDLSLDAAKEKANDPSHPLHAWQQLKLVSPKSDSNLSNSESMELVNTKWKSLAENVSKQRTDHDQFNEQNFKTIADFRSGIPEDWNRDGHSLRNPDLQEPADSIDWSLHHEGDLIVKQLLPRGVTTFSLSEKLNGVIRSPTLERTHRKVSFEVIGGGFSLSRLVFNNCQLNYNHQHSIHHDQYSWITIDFPEETQLLHPYAELATFWDNPKFPDPLGTLGKDTENQRRPWSEHAKNPRTWWGIRRVVAHDSPQLPKEDLGYIAQLYETASITSREELTTRYRQILLGAVARWKNDEATDEDARWLKFALDQGWLSNAQTKLSELASLVQEYRAIENQLVSPQVMPGVSDEGSEFTQPLFTRGDHKKPGEQVNRKYLRAIDLALAGDSLSEKQRNADLSAERGHATGSGRRELARLMTAPSNPWTSRVIVNRVWLWMFGQGIVATPDDFGHLGEAPTHPELLDLLAYRFMQEGWSIKRLVREIALSQTFQRSSRPTDTSRAQDPDNLWLTHYPARRMEGEVIRDALLQVSGRLDRTMYGPSVHPYRETEDTEKRLYLGPLDGDGRRSIYLKVQLMEAPKFLSAFNIPGGKVPQGKRDTTNVPAQSLAMLNDPLVNAMAARWSQTVLQDQRANAEDRFRAMFFAAIGRQATSSEVQQWLQTIEHFRSLHRVSSDQLMTSQAIWHDVAHLIFNLKEFIYIP